MFNIDADLNTVETGVWAEFNGSEFLIAHISNLKFQRALNRLQQPHRKKLEQGTLDPGTHRDMICKAMAEGVLLDWRKVVNNDKAEVPYKAATAFEVLKRDSEFRDFVAEYANNMTNFRAAELEEVGKSSSIG